MKRLLHCLISLLIVLKSMGQDNPNDFKANFPIYGVTTDGATGNNFLLLHEIVDPVKRILLDDHYVMGTISGMRGSSTTSNRKWTVQINSSSSYNNTSASAISLNENSGDLVTLVYYLSDQGRYVNFIALRIPNDAQLGSFSFTGYALNEYFGIVAEGDINLSQVLPFFNNDIGKGYGTTNGTAVSPSDVDFYSQKDTISVKGTFNAQTAQICSNGWVDFFNAQKIDPSIPRLTVGSAHVGAIGQPNYKGDVNGYILVNGSPTVDPATNKNSDISLNGASTYRVLSVHSYNDDNGGGGPRNIVTVGYDGNIDMFTKISAWGRLPTDPDNYIAIGVNASYTPGQFWAKTLLRSQKVRVDLQNWPDYAFNKNYRLPSIHSVKNYIDKHGHLPDVPSAEDVKNNGLDLGGNQAVLLKKIEEMTLYIIKMEGKLEKLERDNKLLKKRMDKAQDIKK